MAILAQGAVLIRLFLPEVESKLRRRISSECPIAVERSNLLPIFQAQLIRYFKGEPVCFRVKFDLSRITNFRRQVLAACVRIPYGQTASYQDLARAAGNEAATRAVGSTMACNPLPLVIPCHRVLRADGTIGGFSSPAGVDQKIRLLQLEGVARPDRNRTSSPKRLFAVSEPE